MDELNKGGMIFAQILLCSLNLVGLILMGNGLVKFFKEQGATITVSKIVFLIAALGNIFSLLYCYDPFAYWHKIHYFNYLIFVFSLFNFFLVASIIIVSLHFSRVILKIYPFKLMLYLSFFVAILLIIGEVVTLIVGLYYNSTYNTQVIDGKKVNSFRVSVFCVLVVYFMVCSMFFFHRLSKIWNVPSDKKRSEYKRLIFSTLIILFFTIIALVINVKKQFFIFF